MTKHSRKSGVLRPTSRSSRVSHGLGGTPTYRSWYSMHDRCLNRNNPSFPYYGAKGITVCDRWRSLSAFVEDMGHRPPGMSLDRIDVSGQYCKENCRWADNLTQQRNRSSVKMTEGKAQDAREMISSGLTQKEVAEWFGIDRSAVSRIISGESWRRRVES